MVLQTLSRSKSTQKNFVMVHPEPQDDYNPSSPPPPEDTTKAPNLRDALSLKYDSLDEESYVPWIEGLKGVIAFETFLFLYFRTFFPAAVYADVVTPEPVWQAGLRKALSPLFWNGDLQWSFFIILSGRVVSIKFLRKQTSDTMASSIFRRPFRFMFPVALAMSIAALINLLDGFSHIEALQKATNSAVTSTPLKYKTVLAFFNSLFNMYWFADALQAGVLAHPGAMLWVITTAFTQAYTNYMTMLLLPYMTRFWRVYLLVLFIIAAWWVDSWAWYTITGLLMADNVTTIAHWGNEAWHLQVDKRKLRLPYVTVPVLLALLGIFLKYLYSDIRPNLIENELNAHTSTYLVGGTMKGYVDYSRPQMRIDNYILVIGTLMTIEMTPWLQRAFSIPVLQYFGHLALSAFLLQGCISYTIGARLFSHFVTTLEWNQMSAGIVILVVDGALTWFASDLFARFVDFSGRWMSSKLYDWYKI